MVPWSPWDDALEQQLRSLLVQGLSAHDIAVELGCGLTRNAVLGKINRLGLSKPFKPRAKQAPRPRKPHTRRPVFIAPPPPPAPQPPPPEPAKPRMRRLQLLSLMDHHCRWPIGDPHKHPFYFCAADRAAGVPYCQHHMSKAFSKPRGPR